MKKITVYLLIAIAGFSLNGCYDLDTYPGDTLGEGLFWKTEDHVEQALMGVYQVMRQGNAYGMQFAFDHYGDLAYVYDLSQAITYGTYTERSGEVQGRWQTLYEGIQRANGFIRQVPELSFLSDGAKASYIAEARFLRGLFYFTLMDIFGGVPYYDETVNVNAEYADMKKPRNSADEIRSHVLDDLSEAVAQLPATRPEAEYGRATKGAAYALRGKVYLYAKDWQKAISDFEEVAYNRSNNYGYALDADYARIFKLYNGAKSSEMIFAIQNKSGVGTEYGMPMNFYMGTRSSYGSCWNNSMPATTLADSYECPDGKPFNWDDIFPGYNAATPDQRKALLSVELTSGVVTGLRSADTAKILSAYTNRDPRLMATLIVPYSWYGGWISNAPKDMLFALDYNVQGNENFGTMRNNKGWVTYFWRKFVTEGNLDGAMSNREHTPFEFPLIRYADVLLMLAEAYNEDGQLDKAVTELNKVRARVNLPGLNSGAAWLSVTSREQMAERIRKERAVELAGEGHRFSDLRRWGWPVASAAMTDVNAVNIYGEFLYTHRFNERDMLWPVPGVEIERNPELEQNPGW
ncbi:MAG: RagB/SusD family nutrient uptake outer membrane protein [Tannerella sp.]|jgi:tetratricopeptide (TPR) repeat protein|nr:RagB/SusD family nutrient uptake outer membrane protein [Tannerella sp.]